MKKCDGEQGFTLIELMVALAVLTILAIAAMPSFSAFRQRSALRSTSEQVLGFWNTARLEAVKRNALVKVGIKTASDGSFCMGAATTNDVSDNKPCDCTSAVPATDICDIARFPSSQSEWQGSTLASSSSAVVIESKRASLADAAGAGVLVGLTAPPGPMSYTVNLNVDALGRGVLCQSSGDTDKLSDYKGRQCSP